MMTKITITMIMIMERDSSNDQCKFSRIAVASDGDQSDNVDVDHNNDPCLLYTSDAADE